MVQIQELIDLKLNAIREAMNLPPAPIPAAKVKKDKEAKVKTVKKTEKVSKPDISKNAGFDSIGFKSGKPKEKVFETLPLNLEEKIKIEVRRGLWIYVSPGADIEAIKAKYNTSKQKPANKANDKDGKPPVYQF